MRFHEDATGNLWLGLLTAIVTGMLLAAVHAVLAIKFKVDQIVSGVAINIFATGATSFVSSRFLERNTDLLNCPARESGGNRFERNTRRVCFLALARLLPSTSFRILWRSRTAHTL